MALRILQFLTVYQLALFAGISFISVLGNVPAFNTLPAPVYTAVTQAMMEPYSDPVRVLMVLTGLTFLLHLWLIPEKKSAYSALILLAFLCVIGGALSTILGNFPINDTIRTWSAENPPSDWAEVRDRWNQINLIRVTLAQLGLASSLVAVLFFQPVRAGAERSSVELKEGVFYGSSGKQSKTVGAQ